MGMTATHGTVPTTVGDLHRGQHLELVGAMYVDGDLLTEPLHCQDIDGNPQVRILCTGWRAPRRFALGTYAEVAA
jgi:hypothetical protein